MPDELQQRVQGILNTHFEPLMKEEWKSSISIYDIGARGQNCIDEVVVWLRSAAIQDHVSSLMLPSAEMMVLDPVDRAGAGDGKPRLRGDTVIIRLLKPVDTEADGPVDLLLEIFQVFEDEDLAESCHSMLLSSTHRTPVEH